ncbi:hypothetical protein [Lentzea sp. NPDC059081]|uniref:hypothetical protein n=1 Tax=Lentzea sp. NPDC059081 TaxID=3346719 RepID=UPI003691BC09
MFPHAQFQFSSTSSSQCVLMSRVTERPCYLDGAVVRKDVTDGKSGTREELRGSQHELAGRDARLHDEQAMNPCANGCSSWHRRHAAEVATSSGGAFSQLFSG